MDARSLTSLIVKLLTDYLKEEVVMIRAVMLAAMGVSCPALAMSKYLLLSLCLISFAWPAAAQQLHYRHGITETYNCPLLPGLLSAPDAARARTSGHNGEDTPRVAMPEAEPEAQACFAAFMQGLQEIRLGRWAQYADRLSLERGDAARLRKHATELVALGPEVPCATGCPPY